MQWTFIVGIAIVLYLAGSIRVLRQYERGVVFLLGRPRASADPASR
jgi:regulator of protease activity HflC (stomatin/prohibitin superfamily)